MFINYHLIKFIYTHSNVIFLTLCLVYSSNLIAGDFSSHTHSQRHVIEKVFPHPSQYFLFSFMARKKENFNFNSISCVSLSYMYDEGSFFTVFWRKSNMFLIVKDVNDEGSERQISTKKNYIILLFFSTLALYCPGSHNL